MTYQPDIVLWMSGFNDFSTTDPRPNYPHHFILEEKNPLRSTSASDFNILPSLLLKSQIIRDWAPDLILRSLRINHPVESWLWTQDRDPETTATTTIQNLILMDHFCKSIGCQFVTILQPILDNKNSLGFPSAIIQKIENTPRLKQLVYYDLNPRFSKSHDGIFRDRVHLTEKGSDLLHEEISRIPIDSILNSRIESNPTLLDELIPEHLLAWPTPLQ